MQPRIQGDASTHDEERHEAERRDERPGQVSGSENASNSQEKKDSPRDFIVEAEEEMQAKGPSPWHGLDLTDFDDWA